MSFQSQLARNAVAEGLMSHFGIKREVICPTALLKDVVFKLSSDALYSCTAQLIEKLIAQYQDSYPGWTRLVQPEDMNRLETVADLEAYVRFVFALCENRRDREFAEREYTEEEREEDRAFAEASMKMAAEVLALDLEEEASAKD
jgi:hypothetical protein